MPISSKITKHGALLIKRMSHGLLTSNLIKNLHMSIFKKIIKAIQGLMELIFGELFINKIV